MGQSDWLRAFFKISREPDLSQTCGFCWIMQDTELNKFREFQKDCLTSFREKYEKPHFLALFPLFPKDQNFFLKIGLRHFSTLIRDYLDAKYLRNLMVGNMITFVTDGQTELIT